MSTDFDIVSSINYATMQINRHGATLMLLFGTIGNILNFLVLTDHSFQENSCSTYLSWAAVTSLVFIWSGFLTRVLQGYVLDVMRKI